MNGTTASKALLSQLQENHTRNTSTLRAAGCSGPVKHVRCPKCGIFEPIVFWTPVDRRGDTLHLSCPSGCSTKVRYDLARTSGVGGDTLQPRLGKWILLPILAYMTAGYLLLTEHGQALAAQVWYASQRQISSLAQGEVPQASRRTPRSARSDGGAAGAHAPRSASGTRHWTQPLLFPWRRNESFEVIFGDGDRAAEIEDLVEGVASIYGAPTRAVIRTVEYLPELGLTRVVVETSTPAWKAYFADRLAAVLSEEPTE